MMSSSRGRFLSLLLLCVTFAAGGLVGAAANRVLEARPASPTETVARESCERRDRDLLSEVGISADQRARVDEILERRRAQADAFWKESGPRLQALTDSTRAEVRAVLDEEQRAAYDRLRAERRERSREIGKRK